MSLAHELETIVKGEVKTDSATLARASRDASVLELKPEVVVAPHDVSDIETLVRFVTEKNKKGAGISLTPRAAGTCMSGGPLSESIVLDMLPHFQGVRSVDTKKQQAVVLSGTYYRDFEKATLAQGLLMPSYTSSREICTVGGMVGNNAGGEKTLAYGQTDRFVESVKVVLADGNEYDIRALDPHELAQKIKEGGFLGDIYQKMFTLLNRNKTVLERARPRVSKNSAGYPLWNVWNGERFDLTKLFVGSQGTLGVITEITFRLVKVPKESRLVVIAVKNLDDLAKITNKLLPIGLESLEVYDDATYKLAARYFFSLMRLVHPKHIISLATAIIPELFGALIGGFPKLTLLAEVTGEKEEVIAKTHAITDALIPLGVRAHVTDPGSERDTYWAIRRESFNLLRKHVHGKRAAPFIDDIIVPPESLPEFLPKLRAILDEYKMLYTVNGHDGNGNLHIIPLVDMTDKKFRHQLPEIAERVFRLVVEFKGSIDAEHNDGIIRTPYLPLMYSSEVLALFAETKRIFDPLNIFNPGKKVPSLPLDGGKFVPSPVSFIESHLVTD